MRSNATGTLDFWHYADNYSAVPTLSESWMAEGKKNGRSYIFGDNDTAQELVDNYSGKGEVKKENTESVTTDKIVGVYKDIDGNEIESNEIIIVTSKTGAHVYPGFPKKKGNK